MKTSVISIVSARYGNDFKIELSFSDGIKKTVDFFPFLSAARNPMTRKYFDVKNFKSFRVEHGDLIWGDYEMCFPIWDLYEGNI